MLSEKINLLRQRPNNTKMCHFAETVRVMSENDKNALIEALVTQSVSIRALERLLLEEGVHIGRDSLSKGRMCITNEEFCKCGFSAEVNK
jgi:hypothetical protein